MPDWFANHFLHPGYAWSWAAAALVAAPIIIHIINRLRYRRVRFAAMEFLLASRKQNRRRVLIEQLLLLLLRIGLVLLVILLIGRFTADATVLNLFQEAKVHHVVLLDDSGSMRDRIGDTSAFDRARTLVRQIAEGCLQQTGTQKFTLLRLSRPEEAVVGLGERPVDLPLLTDLTTTLEDFDCTVKRLSLAEGLTAALTRLKDDTASLRSLHVLTDLRESDWLDDKAIAAVLRDLDAADVQVHLVRTVPESHENLAVTSLTGDLQAAAEGVPVSFQVEVSNLGSRAANNVRLSVAADGTRLPITMEFDAIPAGQSVKQDFYTVFEKADRHSLAVSVDPDALEQDNVRHLALDVPAEIPVLVIDASPDRIQGQYVVDAIADSVGQGRVLTGVSAVLEAPDYLRKYPLDGFQSIVLINVPQLPEDAVVALERYAAAGGGLAWFLGDLVQPEFYRERLYRNGEGIFPVPLASTFATLPHDEGAAPTSDILPSDHPLLRVLTHSESVLLQYVTVNAWYPVEEEWWAAGEGRPQSLEVIATLRNRSPLIFSHTWGPKQARIATFLTAAGPLFLPATSTAAPRMWNNWASDENAAISYLVLQLELQKLIGRKDRLPPLQRVGEPIVRTFSPAEYRPDVEILTPDGRNLHIQAAPVSERTTPSASLAADAAAVLLRAVFDETDQPGVYTLRITRQDGTVETSLVACNVPVEESRLAIATDQQILASLGESRNIVLHSDDTGSPLISDNPGRELRLPLLVALLLLLLVEQYLSYRFSHHPQPSAAA